MALASSDPLDLVSYFNMNTVYVEADYVEADSVVNSLSCM